VIGLDRLVQTLTRLDAARVAGCLVEATGQFALAFFTEDASGVGVLHVPHQTTPPRTPPVRHADGFAVEFGRTVQSTSETDSDANRPTGPESRIAVAVQCRMKEPQLQRTIRWVPRRDRLATPLAGRSTSPLW
jgi:hypothetical protein